MPFNFIPEKDYKLVLSCRECYRLKPVPYRGVVCNGCLKEMEEDWPALHQLFLDNPHVPIEELELLSIKEIDD